MEPEINFPTDKPIHKNGVICKYCGDLVDGYVNYWCGCSKTKNVRGNKEDWSDRNNPKKIN
jgi:hypothetical protein